MRLIADDATRFDIAFQITEPKTSIGDTLDVYHSDDGSSWESLGATCVVDAQRICNISTTRLGLFGLGRAGILNTLTT